MARRHYHVFEGLRGGYMPDGNSVYPTLREAREGLRAVQSELDDWTETSGIPGRADREVLFHCRGRGDFSGWTNHAYITGPCMEADCHDNW